MIYFILITDGGSETSDKGGAIFCLGVLITYGKAVLSFIKINVANHAFGEILLLMVYFWIFGKNLSLKEKDVETKFPQMSTLFLVDHKNDI
jgi:hypothetical protein